MIHSITLHNFRQHQNLKLDFSDGIQVIRGSNEAGKSTVFEAVSYALFGIRACRNNDIATWGEPANSVAVTVVLEAEGKTYRIKRSPRGAEVHADGIMVSGQTEVTRYCEDVLNLKAGMGGKLMFAGQNAMRGVLSEGGAKTAQMIEQLAGFEQIDRWIDTLQEHFGTGSTKIHEEMLDNALQQISRAKNEIAALPDAEAEWKTALGNIEERDQSLVRLTLLKQAELKDADDEVRELASSVEQRDALHLEESKLRADIALARQILATPLPDISEADIVRQKDLIIHLWQCHIDWQDYCQARDYTPAKHLEMPEAEVRELLQRLEQTAKQYAEQIGEYNGQIRALKAHIHTNLACPTCKREWDNVEQMQAANKETEAEIARLEALKSEQETRLSDTEPRIRELKTVLQVPVPKVADGSYWHFDTSYTPPVARWQRADIPAFSDGSKVREAESELLLLERKLADRQELSDKQNRYRTESEQWEAELATVSAKLADISEQSAKLDAARDRRNRLQYEMNDLERQAQVLKTERERVNREHEQAEVFRKHLQATLQTAEDTRCRYADTLSQMRTNNALLKALRSAKPQIADTIWKTLTATISNYFGLMRGQDCIVAKTSDGFTVEGRDISSLSGSTLDILGIAVRVALTKTFIPSCRFLFLDEPFAACDAHRQAQALGFIAASGFDQIIVVTHEDVTETVAGQLIEL